jgi:2-polyprenyl-3-methyl-5-hydroxy-6-metoxy-1,4-benzoquinol methylase
MKEENRFYQNLKPFLNCKDFTVSGEIYEVKLNKEFDFLVTTPIPFDLERYYESENYISHTDSKKSFIDKVYQIVKKRALHNKLKLINSFQTDEKSILDIGAGTGDFLKVCSENNWKIFGTEPSQKARNFAQEKNIILEENISFYEKKKFDVITMWHVLEHVRNLSEYIKQLKSLLKENGRLIVAVPNFKSYDAKHYKQFWAAFDVPRHLFHFSQESIQKLFSEVNLEVEKMLPMKYDAFYVSLLSEKYKTGKSNPMKSFWIGLKSNLKAKQTSEYSSLIYVIKNK